MATNNVDIAWEILADAVREIKKIAFTEDEREELTNLFVQEL
jgi:hypothetical protein